MCTINKLILALFLIATFTNSSFANSKFSSELTDKLMRGETIEVYCNTAKPSGCMYYGVSVLPWKEYAIMKIGRSDIEVVDVKEVGYAPFNGAILYVRLESKKK